MRKSERVWTGKAFTFWHSSKTQIYTHLRKSERVWVSRFAFCRKWKSERLDLRFERKWKCEHLWGIWTARFQWRFPPLDSYFSKREQNISAMMMCIFGFGSWFFLSVSSNTLNLKRKKYFKENVKKISDIVHIFFSF